MNALCSKATRRLVVPVLLGVLAMLLLWAASARAAPALYGGLGTVGELHPIGEFLGEPDGNGVFTTGEHAFAVDSQDGSFYVGDAFENEKEETFIRVQKFEANGKFVAEARIAGEQFEGFAIDPEKHSLYLLLVEEAAGFPTAHELWKVDTNTLKTEALANATDLHAKTKVKGRSSNQRESPPTSPRTTC